MAQPQRRKITLAVLATPEEQTVTAGPPKFAKKGLQLLKMHQGNAGFLRGRAAWFISRRKSEPVPLLYPSYFIGINAPIANQIVVLANALLEFGTSNCAFAVKLSERYGRTSIDLYVFHCCPD